MREIVLDLGATVRSKCPWHGRNMKIQALNGNDFDVRHLALSVLRSPPQEFDAGLISARSKPGSNLSPWNPILLQLTENRDRCEFHATTISGPRRVPRLSELATFDTRPYGLGFDPRHFGL